MLFRCALPRPATRPSAQENCFITPPAQLTSAAGTPFFSETNPSAPVGGLSTHGPTRLLFRTRFLPVSTTEGGRLPAGCFWNGLPSQMNKRNKWLTLSASTGLQSNSRKSIRSPSFSALASTHPTILTTAPRNTTIFTIQRASSSLPSRRTTLPTSQKKYARSKLRAQESSRS